MFEKYDTDKNGSLDLDEFIVCIHTLLDKTDVKDIVHIFNDFDFDKDNIIN